MTKSQNRSALVRGNLMALLMALLFALGGCGGVSTPASGDGQGGGDTVSDDTGPVCTPACDWRACGPDPACGASCGGCVAGQECREGSCIPEGCEPACGDLLCGLDPQCGAVCGKCPDDQHCEAGVCVEGPCTQDCSAQECGPDPVCLASCGICTGGETCVAGACVGGPCVPDCSAQQCGPDPSCGEDCGPCPVGEVCQAGSCVAGPCVPDCSDLDCGPDPICGQECGPCAAGLSCAEGTCVPEGSGACANDADLAILNALDPLGLATSCVVESGCGTNAECIGQCIGLQSGLSEDCADCHGALGACGFRYCLSDCLADQGGPGCMACLEEHCVADYEDCSGVTSPPCTPDCSATECGPDPVCQRSCGSCAADEHCEEGVCVGGPCVPDCAERECGPDPVCGLDCGPCPPGERCRQGDCVPVATGACANDADLGILNETDPVPIAQLCLMESDCGNDPACISRCIAEESGISGECAACYGDLAVCALRNCVADCVLDPGGPDCIPCLEEHCMLDFEACAGIQLTPCEPDCSETQCGRDPVCGESCGRCPPGQACVEGRCGAAPEGACVSPGDLEILNGLDPVPIAEQCLLNAGCGNDRDCIAQCIADEAGITRGCADCYGDLAICGLANCLQVCVLDPSGVGCVACLEESCMDDFEVCAGIRLADCEPACGGRECGPDPVCGAACGSCDAGERCEAGTCVAAPRGACNNADDLTIVATIDDPSGVAAQCLLGGTCGMDETCIAGCIQDETGLSDGCSFCFAQAGTCAATQCLLQCINDFGSPECLGCIQESCGPAFEECAGLAWIIPL